MPARAATTARSAASQALGRRAADREDRQHAVTDELQHLASEGVHRPGDAVEPGVEGGNHRCRLRRLGERGEVAQIGTEQRRADGLSAAAAQRAGLHPGGTAPAEIGLEQRCALLGPSLDRASALSPRGKSAGLPAPE